MNAPACRRCGNCCRVAGYVRLAAGEPASIAARLGLSEREFADRYAVLTADRAALSLAEKPDGACVFLDGGNACAIHAVKPRQCRDFPAGWRFSDWNTICAAARETRHEV